jgi:hypothetical protein
MNFDQLSNFLENTKGQIRAFDNKAQVLLGVNGVLIGFITAEIAKAAEYGGNGLPKRFGLICVVLAAAFPTSCVSMGFALFVINPQLQLSQPTSKFFFCHLARDYGQDYKRAAEDLAALGEAEAVIDIGTQVQANALICNTKSSRCLIAMRCAGIAFGLYALTVPLFCSMAYDGTRRNALQVPVSTVPPPLGLSTKP